MDTNGDLFVQYNKKIDYEKLLQVLNSTKSYVKKFSPHSKLLSQLISITKGFKKEQDLEKPQKKLKELENKVDGLANPKNIVDFYINEKELRKEFDVLSKSSKDIIQYEQEER